MPRVPALLARRAAGDALDELEPLIRRGAGGVDLDDVLVVVDFVEQVAADLADAGDGALVDALALLGRAPLFVAGRRLDLPERDGARAAVAPRVRERLRPFDGVLETQVLQVDQEALVARGAPIAVLHERAQDLVRLGVLLVLLEEADAVPRRAREAIARVEALEPRGQRGDVVRVRRVLVEEAQARRREGLRDLARGRCDRDQGLLDGLRRRVLAVARSLRGRVVAGLLERGAGLLALGAGLPERLDGRVLVGLRAERPRHRRLLDNNAEGLRRRVERARPPERGQRRRRVALLVDVEQLDGVVAPGVAVRAGRGDARGVREARDALRALEVAPRAEQRRHGRRRRLGRPQVGRRQHGH